MQIDLNKYQDFVRGGMQPYCDNHKDHAQHDGTGQRSSRQSCPTPTHRQGKLEVVLRNSRSLKVDNAGDQCSQHNHRHRRHQAIDAC